MLNIERKPLLKFALVQNYVQVMSVLFFNGCENPLRHVTVHDQVPILNLSKGSRFVIGVVLNCKPVCFIIKYIFQRLSTI